MPIRAGTACKILRMSRYRHASTAGSTYFFTVVAYRRRPILCDESMRTALRTSIENVRIVRPFVIDAWVLLQDHLHCIWSLPEGDADFSTRWMMIKRAISFACRDAYHRDDWMSASKRKHRESTIWQRRFWEHQIRDDEDLARHLDYLHFNPVKHGYVSRVADWPYSTFHRHVKEGAYPADWAGAAEVRHRTGISCTILLAVAGALLRCRALAVLVPRRTRRLALHPATAAKLHTLFLRGALTRLTMVD